MKTLGIRCSDSVIGRIERLAQNKGVPPTTMARELIETALNRQDVSTAFEALNRRVDEEFNNLHKNHKDQEEIIRRVGRATTRTLFTLEELSRALVGEPKLKTIMAAVDQAANRQ